MSLKNTLSQNWIGITIGLIGLLLSWYFYQKSVFEPGPVFAIDPIRVQVIDTTKIGQAPISIIDSDGTKIIGDISIITFYIWNVGRKPITSDMIRQPFKFNITDENARILETRIIKTTNELVNPVINRSMENPSYSLDIECSTLDKGDGFSCQVLYEGSLNCMVSFTGAVLGAKSIKTTEDIVSRSIWSKGVFRWYSIFIIFISITYFIVFVVSVGYIIRDLRQKDYTINQCN